MAKASPIQTAFNAGELTPLLDARIDIDKYHKGCQFLENFLLQVQGPATKRGGTRFVKEIKAVSGTEQATLIPFEFSSTQAYILEMGDLYMRVYKDGGAVLETAQTITNITSADPSVLTITGHGYTNGQEVYVTGTGVTLIDGNYFIVANKTANTFEIAEDGTGGAAGGTASRTYEISTTYAKEDVADIQHAQSADIIYMANSSYPPRKASRTGHTSWTMTTIDFDWQPFLDENTDASLTVYTSAASGTGITLTASGALFTADMVNGYFALSEIIASNHDEWVTDTAYVSNDTVTYLGNVYIATINGTSGPRPPLHDVGTETDGAVIWGYQHSGTGYAQITGFTSSTVVTADVIKYLPASTVGPGETTLRWAHGAWSDENGYPATVAFYEDRLVWAGTTNNPQTLWASKSADYENHIVGPFDNFAYSYTLNSDQVNDIRWLNPGKVLTIGTAGGEFVMSASSLEEAITPTNVRVVRQTTYGCAAIKSIRIGNAVVFVQKSGKKFREFFYSFEKDAYDAVDLTQLSEHVTKDGVTKLSYQQEPNHLLWAVRTDGQLICLTYERSEGVVGWHRHPLGGDSVFVESIASIPHPDGDQDQLWLIVRRNINGVDRRYIERLEKEWKPTNDIEDAFFVDSGLTYSGAATMTITGLDHLEAQSISVLIGGMTHPNKIVSNGSITLDRTSGGDKVQLGLGYNSTLQTMRLESGAEDGTAQGKTKRITKISIRLYQTGPGLWFGPDIDNLEELHFREPSMAMDEPVPLFDGDKGPKGWPGGYEKDARITIQHQLPLPCTILAVMPQLNTQDR